eukprot:CAMPEP_0167775240 /NCGR_PEP_ID=MMETSP0111_2-20121227/2443_1 /TAXON_ID=91324 /ORGANISM="Lotharella globosa, Strain CCCM811" /LENGTH=156 /DNA_ID=CAMNT_0007665121 /DNA_START=489 /DNA_END=958 /DNA_ORIENTATION=-
MASVGITFMAYCPLSPFTPPLKNGQIDGSHVAQLQRMRMPTAFVQFRPLFLPEAEEVIDGCDELLHGGALDETAPVTRRTLGANLDPPNGPFSVENGHGVFFIREALVKTNAAVQALKFSRLNELPHAIHAAYLLVGHKQQMDRAQKSLLVLQQPK